MSLPTVLTGTHAGMRDTRTLLEMRHDPEPEAIPEPAEAPAEEEVPADEPANEPEAPDAT